MGCFRINPVCLVVDILQALHMISRDEGLPADGDQFAIFRRGSRLTLCIRLLYLLSLIGSSIF